ncbi:hypothetical protein N0P26_001263 [Acinetobacter baumannii]|uniref:Uncharacterized protein n=4 Tax=Acinetobacter TaxID=469 RepID=A0A3R9RIG7_ACIBA|nr:MULTISPECIES: hypothetical protein [Acinetobacter]MDU6100887.1 hypothetical protein [Acinetobacter sp.]EHT1074249.1 hypothetical protein [Acinetobacter baumannii]EHU1429284.1 hypothetical protein [Acinetobacter baumannii]EHU1559111.1 hypothetical protein [Acinetobacter baumannii]EHU2954035.1 hypothetical protein [Acinetobacter baumannii]
MSTKKYQVRIRKDLSNSPIQQKAASLLGACAVSEIRTLIGNFESLKDAFEKMATVKRLEEYEIISIILIDTDNSEQLGEDFDWENESHV